MNSKNTILIFGIFFCLGCTEQKQTKNPQENHIDTNMFQHHFITRDLPGKTDWGYGCSAMADFDNDGDLDYAFTGNEGLYWFENQENIKWVKHEVGTMPLRFLGATTFDIDKDGWEDIVIGGYWYRNPQSPKSQVFERYRFDEAIETNIHDVVMADVDGNGTQDVVLMGEDVGVFWYEIPSDPKQNMTWKNTAVTLEVLVTEDHIHSGFFPRGVGDLDGDGDNDLVLPDRWMENENNGKSWKKHQLPFGKRGPFGLSSRSWIIDLDNDGDNDIVVTDSDQKASRAAWLENDGNNPPGFKANFLPMSAPGIRGSFHSLFVGDFDNDGDQDIFTCDQEDDTLPPEGAFPRWYIWENISKDDADIHFVERVIFDGKLGGHDALVGDVDGDGDLDIYSKVWNLWPDNANEGREHGDFFENRTN